MDIGGVGKSAGGGVGALTDWLAASERIGSKRIDRKNLWTMCKVLKLIVLQSGIS